jgi:3-isopropylmalate dehydrogenase
MKVAVLPGDGIGAEITPAATRALGELAPDLELVEAPFGAAGIRGFGTPIPDDTLRACKEADAVLKGPIGDPEFDAADVRPEQGVFVLRSELGVYANFRPARDDGTDLVIVRELLGGIYYGARGVRDDGTVYDTCEYRPDQVERIVRRSFELARRRSRKLTSIDKANVLETSRMWRRVVHDVAVDYPDVELQDMLVDNAAMQLARAANQFDVLVADNMFGDILSDLAAAVTGGVGLAPSASLGDGPGGLFEPVHGSAPDIAGRGCANPSAMLRSTAMMLDLAFDRQDEARALEDAVDRAIASTPTPDIDGSASTVEFADAVMAALAS